MAHSVARTAGSKSKMLRLVLQFVAVDVAVEKAIWTNVYKGCCGVAVVQGGRMGG